MTERIWEDMLGFEGHAGHELLQDLDDPGHLLVVSRWASRGSTPTGCSPSTPAARTRAKANRLAGHPEGRLAPSPPG